MMYYVSIRVYDDVRQDLVDNMAIHASQIK